MKISYSKKRLFFIYSKVITLVIILAFISGFLMFYGLSRMNFGSVLFINSLFYFAFGILFSYLYRKVMEMSDSFADKINKEATPFKKGLEGEKVVSDELNKILDQNQYKIYKNFQIPGTNFDIDIIIIGPKGLMVLEVKNYTNQLIFSGDEVFYTNTKRRELIPLTPEKDPREQVKRHCYTLSKYLKSLGYNDIKIKKALVFPKKYSISVNGSTGIYIACGTESLKEFLDGSYLDERFAPEFINNLAAIFEK